MRLITVFHGENATNLGNRDAQIGSNPPMTPDGMEKMLCLVPVIKKLAPFDAVYSARTARTLDTASILALALNVDFKTIKDLGRHANTDNNITTAFPGNENEDMCTWQKDALSAVSIIYQTELRQNEFGRNVSTAEYKVLSVTHKEIIAGLIGATKGISDLNGLNDIVNDPHLSRDGFVVFYFDGQSLTKFE